MLRGRLLAMHWHYIMVYLTLIFHSSFVHGPLATLQTLWDHAAVVWTAIAPPAAPTPCELCYCIVRVIRLYIYLLLAFVELLLFGLAQFG